MKLDFSQQTFFFKYSDLKFYKNPSSGSRVIPCGRTDGHADTIKLMEICEVPKRSNRNRGTSSFSGYREISLRGVKQPGRDANHLFPSSIQIK